MLLETLLVRAPVVMTELDSNRSGNGCPKKRTRRKIPRKNVAPGEIVRLVMADGADARRGLIKDDTPSINVSMARVTEFARDLLVGAFEGKVALRLVIKDRGLPVFRIVALVTAFDLPSFDELARMGVPMACGAVRGG